MTTEIHLAAILIGSTLLTLVGLYIGWRTVRVDLLRLELLSIRNRLWDAARESNGLNDPVYRTYRDNLNLMVRYAHKIDLVSLAISSRYSEKEGDQCVCNNKKLKNELEQALASTGRCMSRYLLWHRPFTGIFLVWTLNLAARTLKVASYFRRFSSAAIRSSAPQIRSFGQSPDLKAKEWFEHNGPAIIFGRHESHGCV